MTDPTIVALHGGAGGEVILAGYLLRLLAQGLVFGLITLFVVLGLRGFEAARSAVAHDRGPGES